MKRSFFLDSDLDSDTNLINLTPLIDVVFVVLFIFIILAPLLELEHVQLADSSKNNLYHTSAQNCSHISIHVHADNSLWMNGHKVSKAELKKELHHAKKEFPHEIPQLFQDKNASFGSYQTVKNIAQEVGFHQMDLILQPG